MNMLIKNGRVIDPANRIDSIQDISVKDGKITALAKDLPKSCDNVIDATGKIVMPGLIDMHVHLREPGGEDKETVETGTSAALKGGVTAVLAMPNTLPSIDTIEQVMSLKDIIKSTAKSRVYISAAITKGRAGELILDYKGLKREGVVAITDDGDSVGSEVVMLEALKQAAKEKILVICHCEDKSLVKGGVVNLGLISTQLGLRGISSESEYRRVLRDVELAHKTDSRIHIAHISTKESVDIIAEAKKKGVKVTAETAPHYFSLTDEAVMEYDTNMKMNPPLRGRRDLEAVLSGLKDGVIDVIASDHAPHTENEKEIEFDYAAFGVTGLETSLSVAITNLIEPGVLNWVGLAEKMALNPAKILNIDGGTLGVGKQADIVIVDPNSQWEVKREDFVSKSKNSAFLGKALKGRVEYTIIGGEVVYDAGSVARK